jgi:hypothetical protein
VFGNFRIEWNLASQGISQEKRMKRWPRLLAPGRGCPFLSIDIKIGMVSVYFRRG